MSPAESNRLTIRQRRRARKLAYVNGGLWGAGNGMVTTTLVVYLSWELEAKGLAVSLILAAPQLAGVLRLFAPALIDGLGSRKRFCLRGYVASGLVLLGLPVIATPGRLANINQSLAALVTLWCVYHLLEYLATIALWSWPGLLRVAGDAGLDEAAIVRQVAFNALVFWEVFFVFGWLQLRFERAFGILPAIPLASLGFAAYHFGTFPTEGLIELFQVGLVFAIAFRITRSVLALIPIAWSVVSSIGTIPAGFLATWEAVYLYIVVVGIQVAGLALLIRSSRERQPGNGSP